MRDWLGKPKRRYLILVKVALIGIVLTAGCSPTVTNTPSASPSVPEPTLGVVKTITAPEQISRPIDQYVPNVAVVVRLQAAEANLYEECFRREGVSGSWQVSGNVSDWVSVQRRNTVTRSQSWGFFDPTNAPSLGYFSDQSLDLSEGAPVGSDDEVVGRCVELEQAKMPYGQPWMSFAYGGLPNANPHMAGSDSRFVAAQDEWAACMKAQGFDLASVQDALSTWDPARTAASPTEVATAVADIDCKLETNFIGIALAVQTAYDLRYIDANRPALTEFQTKIDEFLREQGR